MSELSEIYFHDCDPEELLNGKAVVEFDREEEARRECLDALGDIYEEIDDARTKLGMLYDDRSITWQSYAKISDHMLKAMNAIERIR